MKKPVFIISVVMLVILLAFSACAAPTSQPAVPTPSAPTPSQAPTPSPTPAAAPTPAQTPAPAPASTPAPATVSKPVKLKMVVFLPINAPEIIPAINLVEQVNKRSNGQLIIDLLGGPETIPLAQQAEACRNGVVDMLLTVGGWTGNLIPASQSMMLSQLSCEEERTKGAYDAFVKDFEKAGFRYLGRSGDVLPELPDGSFTVNTKKLIENPRTDFKGLKLRGANIYEGFTKALGASLVIMPHADAYTALERGTVDGHIMAYDTTWGWQNVCKYCIEPAFFSQNIYFMTNLASWNKIPQNMQKLIMDVVVEEENKPTYGNGFIKTRASMLEKMQLITLSPDNAKWFSDMVYSESWKWAIGQGVDPKYKELLSK